jgi:hypothetical protein
VFTLSANEFSGIFTYSSHRVPEFLSLRRNWIPPPPPPTSECVSLPRTGPNGVLYGLNSRNLHKCLPCAYSKQAFNCRRFRWKGIFVTEVFRVSSHVAFFVWLISKYKDDISSEIFYWVHHTLWGCVQRALYVLFLIISSVCTLFHTVDAV